MALAVTCGMGLATSGSGDEEIRALTWFLRGHYKSKELFWIPRPLELSIVAKDSAGACGFTATPIVPDKAKYAAKAIAYANKQISEMSKMSVLAVLPYDPKTDKATVDLIFRFMRLNKPVKYLCGAFSPIDRCFATAQSQKEMVMP